MSLLNAIVASPECVLVSVDTEGVMNAHTFECAKLLTLPHLNAVIAARGILKSFIDIHAQMIASIGSFDVLAACLPATIAEVVGATVKAAPALGMDIEEAGRIELLFAGWSEKYQRVVVHHYRQTSPADGVAENLCVNSVLSPWDTGDSLGGIEPDRAGLMEIARRQVSAIRERHPGKAGGGRLIITEVRRGSVHLDHVMRFPDRTDGYTDADALMTKLTDGLGAAIAEAGLLRNESGVLQ